MKIFAASFAAFALLAAAAPAAAEPGTATASAGSQTAAAASQARPAKADRKFCKRLDNSARRTEAVTLCLTREEWKKFDSADD